MAVVVPLLAHVAITGKVTPVTRVGLATVAVGTLLVDGSLLSKFLRKRRRKR